MWLCFNVCNKIQCTCVYVVTRLDLIMAFFPLLTSPLLSRLLLPSGPRALPSGARASLRRLFLRPSLVRRQQHLGRIPFPFPLSPITCFLHLLLICLPSSLLLLSLLYASPLFPRFSHSLTFPSASTCCPLSPTLGSHQEGEMMIESRVFIEN